MTEPSCDGQAAAEWPQQKLGEGVRRWGGTGSPPLGPLASFGTLPVYGARPNAGYKLVLWISRPAMGGYRVQGGREGGRDGWRSGTWAAVSGWLWRARRWISDHVACYGMRSRGLARQSAASVATQPAQPAAAGCRLHPAALLCARSGRSHWPRINRRRCGRNCVQGTTRGRKQWVLSTDLVILCVTRCPAESCLTLVSVQRESQL